MSRLVDLGPGYGTVAFPDDATDEQIVAQYDQLEADRTRTLRLAEMVTRNRVEEAEREQPSIGKTLIRAGTALREQTPGALKQVVGNVARTIAESFMVPREGLRITGPPEIPTDPDHPLNILRSEGIGLERQGREQREAATELGRSVGGGVPAAVAESLAGTAGISATALPAAVFGLGPAATAAAVQQYGLTLSEFRDSLKTQNPNLSDDDAFRQAQGPAVLTGIATGLLTRGFGGVERFVERITREGLKKEGVKGLLREMWQSASLEFPEEYGDQLAQGFIEKAFVNPSKPVGDIFNEAGLAGLAGFALGGLTTGAIGGPVVAGEAAGRAAERSRVRRESARASEERIKRVLAKREREQSSAPPSGQTELIQPSPEGLSAAFEMLSNFPQRNALQEHGFESLRVDGKRAVIAAMRAALGNEEIGNSIVESIPISVVNDLIGSKLPSEELLDNKAVLINRLRAAEFGPDLPVGTLSGRFIDSVFSKPALGETQTGAVNAFGTSPTSLAGKENLTAPTAFERIHAQVEQQLKGVSNATRTRKKTGPSTSTGKQTQVEQGAQEPLQVRRSEGDGMETEDGADLADKPEEQDPLRLSNRPTLITSLERELNKNKPFNLQVSGDGTFPSAYLRDKLKTLPAIEQELLANADIESFLNKKTRVTSADVKKWLSKNGPRVDVQVYGMGGPASAAAVLHGELMHSWFENLDYRVRNSVERAAREAENGKENNADFNSWRNQAIEDGLIGITDRDARHKWIGKLDRFIDAHVEIRKEANRGPAATPHYKQISAFNTDEPMPDWTKSKEQKNVQRVDLVLPLKTPKGWKKIDSGTYQDAQGRIRYPIGSEATGNMKGVVWPQDSIHENIPNTLGWAMIQYRTGPNGEKIAVIVEAQSRWAQRARELEEKGTGDVTAEQYDRITGQPLLSEYNRLIIKAAIDQARKEGATHIVISDAETAMMSEKLDYVPRDTHQKVFVSFGNETVQTRGRQGSDAYTDIFIKGLKGKTHPEDERIKLTGHVRVFPGRTGELYNTPLAVRQVSFQGRRGDSGPMDTWALKEDAQRKLGVKIETFVEEAGRPEREEGFQFNYGDKYWLIDKKGNRLSKEFFPTQQDAESFARNRTAGLGLRDGEFSVETGQLNKIAQALTGQRGETVSLGEHKNAYDTERANFVPGVYNVPALRQEIGVSRIADRRLPNGKVRVIEDVLEEGGESIRHNRVEYQEHTGEWLEIDNLMHRDRRKVFDSIPREQAPLRTNLILKNPDGTPKTNVTGMMYDLGPVSKRLTMEPFSIAGRYEEFFGNRRNPSEAETRHLFGQFTYKVMNNIPVTLTDVLRAAVATSNRFHPKIEQALLNLLQMVETENIAAQGANSVRITFDFDKGNTYSPSENRINLNPQTAGSRTVFHEVIHALTARYIERYIGSKILRGKEMLDHFKKMQKDKAVPQLVKDLIDMYLTAAKHLKIETQLFGGAPTNIEVTKIGAGREADGSYTIIGSASNREFLRNFIKRLEGKGIEGIKIIGASADPMMSDDFVINFSPQAVQSLANSGVVDGTIGDESLWIGIPQVGTTTGIAGMGTHAHGLTKAGLPYGMANLDEFLAEAFTSEQFQLLLDSIPSVGGKSVWSRFLDWLKSIFPFFNDPTLLSDVIVAGEEIMKRTIEFQNVPFRPRDIGKTAQEEIVDQTTVEHSAKLTQTLESDRPAPPPQFFQTQAQVQQAIDNPGISALQQQQARDLAAVQSSMSPDAIVGWLMASPADKYNRFAQKRLAYIEDRRHLSSLQRSLVSMPENTPEETRSKQVAGAQILGHYGVDRSMERTINAELLADQDPYAKAVAKLGKLSNEQLKANFLTGLFNRLTKDYRVHLQNLAAAAPAAQNLQAQWRQRVADAERRLNEHAASPTALKHAISALASMMPDTMAGIVSTGLASNQDIITWAITSDVLNGVVGQDVRNWLLVDDGTGSPALLGYARLAEDLTSLRDILANQQTLAQEIQAFLDWFGASGTAVPPKRFAEAYFKFRTARDRAVKLAAGIEKEIETLDLRIRGNTIARDRLHGMMTSPDYVATVRAAARIADVVVRALYDSQDNRTGLIERDKTVGRWRMVGPNTNTEYVVDLYPSSAQEAVNRGQLTAFVHEARTWAAANRGTDPLLADEYDNLSDYIEKYLVHPSLDPIQGFIQEPWMQIPGTRIRIPTDPFDVWSKVTGPLFRTIRDTLERIGGRVTKQAVLDSHELDRVMRRIDGLNHNEKFGFQAQTQAILKAMKSHGWTNEQFARWDEDVAEKLIAAGQNNLGPGYDVGDRLVGSGVVLTSEDLAAVKVMKQWQDAVLAVAPKSVMEQLADLGISRKAVALGRLTMARTAAPWTNEFSIQWLDAKDDRAKLRLLSEDRVFRRVVMGYVGEFNPELNKMNPANDHKSPLFEIYRRMALTEKQGVDTFESLDEVLDFIANELISGPNPSMDFATAKTSAGNTLLAEIKAFIKSFQDNILNYKTDQTFGGLPPSVIQVATANNSFTNPRGLLVAPSTFYTYSMANDGARLKYVGNLRSFLNLRLLQSGKEAMAALNVKRTEYEDKIQDEMRTGLSRRKATRKVLDQSIRDKKASQIRYDYKELINAIAALERVFGALERFEASTVDHYEHAGVAALNNVFGTVKAFLLSSAQAMTTNFWSGSLLGPAIFHWQTGQYIKALIDVVPAPHMWRTLIAKVSDMVASNPIMSRLLRMHAPLWDTLAENVIKASMDWRRVQQTAETSGMVAPYNLRKVFANKAALKRTAGRLDTDTPQPISDFFNYFLSLPGVRHVSETIKAGFPRLFDNMINYSLITSFETDMKFLAKNGWAAFKAREDGAPPGHNWQDLSNPDNVLLPGDLGLTSHKGLERYQQLFAPLGSLDQVILDYYNRTRGMTKEQREEEPLIESPDDYMALALEYAAITNVATETRRSFTLKGKGSDGVWRNFIGTFQGWVTNMTKQFSKALQTHSKDKNFVSIANNMAGLGIIIVLLATVGAWNWEFGDELTKILYNQSSARIQPGNIKDAETATMYFIQALVNTVPIYGPFVGNLAGLAFTGRGKPFDPASLMPAVGFALGTYDTAKRIVQTGDVLLPMADWSRNWMPFSKILINRAPIVQGLVEQQNAVRSLNGSAPSDVEIKWGQRSGDVRYSPVNDEVMKLVSSAYDVVSRGGSIQVVRERMNDVIDAYMATGRSREEAVKLAASALASKEPIRILTGREMVPQEEKRWLARMTPEQKSDYNKAVAAWKVLSQVTGRDLNMVTTQAAVGTGGGGGGGGGGVRLSLGGGRGRSRLRRGRSTRSRLLRRTSTSRGRGPRVSLRRGTTRRRLLR